MYGLGDILAVEEKMVEGVYLVGLLGPVTLTYSLHIPRLQTYDGCMYVCMRVCISMYVCMQKNMEVYKPVNEQV